MWILPNQLHTSAFALDTGALTLDLNERSLACEQSLLVRSKPLRSPIWSRKWKRDSWTQHLSGRILKDSLTETFTALWTSSLGATHVNRSVPLENASETKTHDTCGRSSSLESNSCDPECASLKTSRDTFPSAFKKSSVTWKERVTEQRGEYSRRLKSAHLTRESGCSSWPTPTVAEGSKIGTQPNYGQLGLSNHPSIVGVCTRAPLNKSGRPAPENLNTLGSPQGSPLWPTIRASDGQHGGPNQRGSKGDLMLPSAVCLWATPNCTDGKTGSTTTQGRSLVADVGSFGKLNPRWVETLMGLPVGWTMPSCVSPVTPGLMSYASSVTE